MHNQTVRATVFKANSAAPQTKQIYEDDFSELYGEDIIAPPYNIIELKTIAEYSTILQQCIDAYRVNITGFGFDVEYTFDVNATDVDQAKKKRAEKDWARLEAFYKCLHFDESAEMILGYAIEDREKTGNGFMEVLRDGMGKPAGIEYLDVKNMRVCGAGEPVEVSFMYEENGKVKRIKRQKRFRKYVQMINGKKVFFKEYGDPRKMDMRTGEYVSTLAEKYQANEAIHLKIGSGVYGVPRWVGNIVNLYGARKAEELNFMYFKQGRHVPAAITVENGMLSEASYRELQEYMNDLEGVENAHKFLLIEAEGIAKEKDLHGGEDITPVSVEIKSLAEILQNDALFLEYDEKSRNKLRSAFRLPPLYTGEAQEYNRATADTARKITEEQVFQPERKTLVNKLNTLLLPELNIHDVRLTLKGPDFRDPLEIAKVLGPFITAGAVSPNDLRDLAGRVLGKTLEEWPEEIYKRPTGQDAEKTNLTALMQELKESIEAIKTS
ncbi:phage portal protein [Bacillus inaquosorum]|uniref:phage portal protein n=1 Tax=Bacillus inaquosorum TaxID=483913 RepID=UPI0022808715|nr:phage portal protein [Bacillus inaquosorum]MCY7950779.1 phage portal protein [Bacillus inaquosorum]MCY8071385.1 phage portal protein [Bacillus inaquosorum]MCY9381233.1 phage portal protein [Bacillus inaquosorum]MEC0519379.1 phage portal protein [Bacillus inaquosorum]MEC0605152.1 phage portal protein [Bacillus inaquosorum]